MMLNIQRQGGGPKLPDFTPAEEQIGTAIEGVRGRLESGASVPCITVQLGSVVPAFKTS